MATTDFIAAIELGSSKIAGIAGKKNSDGSIQVLAYDREDSSSFIRKGWNKYSRISLEFGNQIMCTKKKQ